jgi:hypothetical protein
MAMFGRGLLSEGFYLEDESGDLTKIDDPSAIKAGRYRGTLYHHDGFSFDRVDLKEEKPRDPLRVLKIIEAVKKPIEPS